MGEFSSYCEFAASLEREHPDRQYHDREYGFPLRSDSGLFGRLILEIMQAGLSWSLILRKRDAIERAFSGFDIDAVAAYDEGDLLSLLADPGIIRNRLKIGAVIENAKRLQVLRAEHGSIDAWLASLHPRGKDEWVRAFKRRLVFTGGEITGEFLMSTGWLAGAHVEACPVHAKVLAAGAPWAQSVG